MPTLSITLSSAAVAELNDAFAELYGYQATVQTGTDAEGNPIMGPNPVSKAQFARQQVIAFMKERVQTYRRTEALKAASTADADIT